MDIVRIVIKSGSGYGPVDEAYEDKITLTPTSITYKYKPHPMSRLETNVYRKWSYKTTSPVFKKFYEKIAAKTPEYLYNNDILFAPDIGQTTIIATFEDKHKETVNYFCPNTFFADYFRMIKNLVPSCEYVPAVLLTQEDYETEK